MSHSWSGVIILLVWLVRVQDIKYQMKLDMYDFCTPELQEKLLPIRMKFKEVEDRKTVGGG